jgi:hypothetical protein
MEEDPKNLGSEIDFLNRDIIEELKKKCENSPLNLYLKYSNRAKGEDAETKPISEYKPN